VSVRFLYVDESYDSTAFCLSAIAIRHSEWQECFTAVKNHRLRLRDEFGIKLTKELHAHQFVPGRGHISDREISKWQRSRIFLGLLQLVARLPGVMVFNDCLKSADHKDPQMAAWDRLINRVERTMLAFEDREIPWRGKIIDTVRGLIPQQDFARLESRLKAYRARAFFIADEGKEQQIIAALRRMHVHNPIPSRYGNWPSSGRTKNIVAERIIEDPFFKKSQGSYLIQLADCVAYALLKREVPPTPHVDRYGIDKMFQAALSAVCFMDASRSDPLGIVR
jgi:hypothetical protein